MCCRILFRQRKLGLWLFHFNHYQWLSCSSPGFLLYYYFVIRVRTGFGIGQGVFQNLKSLGKSGFVIMAMEIYVLAVNKIIRKNCFVSPNIWPRPKAPAIVNVGLCTFPPCLQHLKPQNEFAWKWFWKFRVVGCVKFWKSYGNNEMVKAALLLTGITTTFICLHWNVAISNDQETKHVNWQQI
jgi:hypothetical protein